MSNTLCSDKITPFSVRTIDREKRYVDRLYHRVVDWIEGKILGNKITNCAADTNKKASHSNIS